MPRGGGLRKRHRGAAKARREAHNRKREWSDYITTQFMNFDSNSTGKLEATQLGDFLQKMAEDDGHGKLSKAELASAVGFIMKAADASGDGAIDEDELKFAVSAWKNWSHSATRLSERVSSLLKKYDTDMSGALNKEQLAEMLKDLNDGNPVEDQELTRIIEGADKRENGMIDMEEIYPALALWYQIPDDEVESASDNLVVVKPTGCHMKGCACAVQ
jgi:Ca2+-binding EF-hand superfamily protein